MATYVPAKVSTQFIFYASLVSQANPKIMQVNPTIAAGDFKVSIDGGALVNLNTIPAVTPVSSALVKFTLSTAEMAGANATVYCSDASGSEWCDLTINIQTAARQVDDLAWPTTTGRSIDVAATGEVGLDFNNILSSALITLNSLAVTGGITSDITGNLSGSVGSVTGAVGSVTGAVGSVTGAVGSIGAAGIAAASFAANAITATAIAADAIGASEIADGAIDAGAIASDAITAAKIADGAIDAATFAAGAITATVIATDAIDADALAADAVTEIWAKTVAELAQAAPSATPSALNALALLYMALRNQVTVSATTKTFSNDAGTVIVKKTLSDDGSTYTEAEAAAGP